MPLWRLRPSWKQPTIRLNRPLVSWGDHRIVGDNGGSDSGPPLKDSKMTSSETMQIATKISEASRQVEETAIQVAQKRVDRTQLTHRVSDSAAEMSDYILTRARKAG
jgi:hypothetical protein